MARSDPTHPRRTAPRRGAFALALALSAALVVAGCGHRTTKAKGSSTTTTRAGAASTDPSGSGGGAGNGTGGTAGSATSVAGRTTLPGASGSGGNTSGGSTGSTGSTTAGPGGGSGTAGGTGAGGAATTTAASAPATPATLPVSANADLVQRVFARLYSYSLNVQEASCIDRALPAADLQALDAGGDQDPGPDQIVEIAQALARCEPGAFVEDQASLLVETDGITDAQATCIGHAVDALALADRTVAGVLLDDWAQLPAGASLDAMVAAVATCVDHDTAATIVSG